MKLAALLPVLLSGCLILGLPPAEETQGYSAEMLASQFEQATALKFTLADFAGDTLGLEIVTLEESHVQVHVSLDLTTSEGTSAPGQTIEEATPRPCMSVYSPSYRAQVIGALRMPGLMLSAGGQHAELRAQTFETTMDNVLSFEAGSWDAGLSVPVVVALDGAPAWHALGSDVTVTLQSDEPFWYRERVAGDLDCNMLVSEGEGGQAVDLGSVVIARNQEFSFTLDNSNMIGTFIASDISHHARLTLDGHVYDESAASLDEFAWHWASGTAPAGDYVWTIKDLQGTNDPVNWTTGAALIVQDLEDWVVVAPWLSGPE